MNVQELKNRKKAIKATTQDIASLADIPYGTLSKIFTGETKSLKHITMEKIDVALSKLEQEYRIKAYQKAMYEYFKKRPNEEQDPVAYEKIYRIENHLSPDPIPLAVPVEKMEKGNLALKLNRISVEQYFQMNTDKYTQLVDGKLIFSNAPNFEHQAVIEELGDSIKSFIREKDGKCKVYTAGLNLRLDEDDDTLLIPDIIVRCEGGTVTKEGLLGAPEWIVEVTSESTRKIDYRHKVFKYMDGGVKEYWIVDLQKRIVATYINDLPYVTAIYQFSDAIPVFIYSNELVIKMEDILRRGV